MENVQKTEKTMSQTVQETIITTVVASLVGAVVNMMTQKAVMRVFDVRNERRAEKAIETLES